MRLARFVLPSMMIFSAGACPAASGWDTDWESACSTAVSRQKPLVAVFEHEGCPECSRMSQTLSADSSRSALASAVKVRLECDRSPELVSRYEVTLTPTLLVFTPESGSLKEVYREVGAMSVGRVVQVGQSIDKLADRLEQKAAAKEQALASAVPPVAPAPSQVENAPAEKPAASPTRTTRKKKRTTRTVKKQEQPQRSRYSGSTGQPAQRQYQSQEQRQHRFWPFW